MAFFLLKHFNRNANVVVDGTPNIHKDADVEVGKYSMLKIGYGFTMRKNSIIAVRDNAQLRIGYKVFINRNTIIMARQNITIGEHCVIASGVIVTKDVPANTVLIQKRINTEYSL